MTQTMPGRQDRLVQTHFVEADDGLRLPDDVELMIGGDETIAGNDGRGNLPPLSSIVEQDVPRLADSVLLDLEPDTRTRALQGIVALNLLGYRNELEAKYRFVLELGGTLEGKTRAQSKLEAHDAFKKAQRLGKRVLFAYARSLGVEPTEDGPYVDEATMSRYLAFDARFKGIGPDARRLRADERSRLARRGPNDPAA